MQRNVSSKSKVVRGAGLAILAFAVILSVVVGATAATLPGCRGCHFKDATFKRATAATPHGQIDCVACHVSRSDVLQRTKFAVYETFGMRVPLLDPSATDTGQPKDLLCLNCHQAVRRGVTEASGLRIKHSACARGRRCVDCHSTVGHGSATKWVRTSSMNDCVRCHRDQSVSLECEECHTGQVRGERPKWPEFTVTHGPNWLKTHGMGDMTMCSECHESSKCASCHGPGVPHPANFILDHAATSQLPAAKCTMCHQKTFCQGCHGIEMPHPESFVSQHSRIVAESGRARCLRCHDESDCENCHVRHVHPGGSVGNLPPVNAGALR